MTQRPRHLSCIGCGRELDPTGPAGELHQPSGGTQFTSYGHYGSTAFDPMDGQQLSVIVCDPCLVKHHSRVQHTPADPKTGWSDWEPNERAKSWVAFQAADHNAPFGVPTTLLDGTRIDVISTQPGTEACFLIDGAEVTVRIGEKFVSRTQDCYVTDVWKHPGGLRENDAWYPAFTFTEGKQPTFEEWNDANSRSTGA